MEYPPHRPPQPGDLLSSQALEQNACTVRILTLIDKEPTNVPTQSPIVTVLNNPATCLETAMRSYGNSRFVVKGDYQVNLNALNPKKIIGGTIHLNRRCQYPSGQQGNPQNFNVYVLPACMTRPNPNLGSGTTSCRVGKITARVYFNDA